MTGSSTLYDVISFTGVPAGSSTQYDIIGSPLIPHGSSTLYDQVEAPIFDPTALSRLVGKAVGRSHTAMISGAIRLATTTGIDPFTPGSIAIHVGSASQFTAVQLIVVRCTAASGVTSAMTAGVGAIGTDVLPPQQLVGLTEVGKHWVFPSGTGAFALVFPGATLNLVISAAPTGTSQTVAVDVFGHEL